MDLHEITSFLDLSDGASGPEIKAKALEKKKFFEHLSNNSQNQVLKNLHQKNVEKVNAILQFLEQQKSYVAPTPPPAPTPPAYQNHFSDLSPTKPAIVQGANAQELGWLVRHTEGLPTLSYAIFEGTNVIGREEHPELYSIVYPHDKYISRQHAVIEAKLDTSISFVLKDGVGNPSKNGTYLNAAEQRLVSPASLKDGDTIQIGMTKLILKVNQGVALKQIEHAVEESEYMKTVIINIL